MAGRSHCQRRRLERYQSGLDPSNLTHGDWSHIGRAHSGSARPAASQAAQLSIAGQLLYRPADVYVVIGATVITGFATGSFVTARRNKPTWKGIKGCDGEGIRVRTNDYSATISIKLRQGSPSNDFLSSLILADEISGVLASPMTVQHIPGRSLYVSSFTSIEGPADLVFGTEEQDVTWTFISDNWQPFTGGFNPILRLAPR